MSSPSHYDLAIIGGGHNGLVCAAYAAAAGLRVIVLEKNVVIGGAAITEEFHPGFRNSVASYTVSLLDPGITRDLELAAHGLRIIERPMANFWPVDTQADAPLNAPRSLLLPWGLAGRQAAIAAFSPKDAAQLPEYEAALSRAAAVLRNLARVTPPNAGGGWGELFRSGWLGRHTVRLPIADQRHLVELFTASVADYLDRRFESGIVKAAFAFDGIVGNYAAPSTPGTAYVLLHHAFGHVNGRTGVWGHAVGGMGAITHAMAAVARARGVIIRTEAEVAEVLVRDGRVVGVRLASGDIVSARAVATNIPPKLLFRALLPASAVSEDVRALFTGIKSGSGTFRMNVALSELPDFRTRPGTHLQDHHTAGIIIGPSLAYLEQAYGDARTEGWSRQPAIEMLIPSTYDSSLAPADQHVASLFVQHVAPRLPDGRSWDDPAEKEAFADLVIATMTTHAPNFARSLLGRQILSPRDLEQRFGLIDGDIFHGQLCLGQTFSARPVLGYADYRLPIRGLYLCGSGAHPGGGVTGLPGHNAAREIVRDLKRGRRMTYRP